MVKRKIAVCDSDTLYRERFTAYLMNHRSEEMDVHAFSGIDIFLEDMKKEFYDLVLLEEGLEEAAAEIGKMGMPVLILTSNAAGHGTKEAAETSGKEEWEPSYTLKYQPMDIMVKQIYLLTDLKERTEKGQYALSELEVVGIWSPIHHEMQQLFSVLYALQMAQEKRILYLNFLEYSGFLELFSQSCEYDMGDLILRLRNESLTAEQFRQCVYEMRDISYIPPFKNPENIHEFCQQDLKLLLDYLAANTDYEMIVIDFGSGMQQFLQMLSGCTYIYCLMKEGFFYQCQLNEFLEYVQKIGEDAVLKKMEIIKLPYHAKWLREGTNLVEQLNWSEFGDFVRNYRSGGRFET